MTSLVSYNPANGQKLGEVKVSTKSEVTEAVIRAKKAFPKWRDTKVEERAKFVEKFRENVLKHKKELAELVTLEMGKPLSESLADVDWDQAYFKHWVEKAPLALKNKLLLKDNGGESWLIKEPLGVGAIITPWNFPLGNTILGTIPAILSGNTVVFKHSEYTPLCGKRMIELLWETGIPKGVVNMIYGGGEVGANLIDSPIDFVWFTGSTKVGKEIYRKCAEKFISCLLELGGSSPAIIFNDVDLDSVVKEIYFARFLNSGQVCSAVKRCFVEKKIFKPFVEKLIVLLKTKKIGDPMKNVDFGPLVSKKQLESLEEQIKDAIEKGAKVIIGGKSPKGKEFEKGYYFEPTILTNVDFQMKVMSEEVFGPVLSIMPFYNEEGAIEMANNTKYGLSSEIYTKDLERAKKIALKLEAGSVSINTDSFFFPECPFGGYKKSGIGRGSGEFDFQNFTKVKHLRIAK